MEKNKISITVKESGSIHVETSYRDFMTRNLADILMIVKMEMECIIDEVNGKPVEVKSVQDKIDERYDTVTETVGDHFALNDEEVRYQNIKKRLMKELKIVGYELLDKE